jgi:hypothetical protein
MGSGLTSNRRDYNQSQIYDNADAQQFPDNCLFGFFNEIADENRRRRKGQ